MSMEQEEIQTIVARLQDECEKLNARIDGNSARIDTISAATRELAMKPPPELGKGISALIGVSITIALASLAATLTTVGLLLSHVLGGH